MVREDSAGGRYQAGGYREVLLSPTIAIVASTGSEVTA